MRAGANRKHGRSNARRGRKVPPVIRTLHCGATHTTFGTKRYCVKNAVRQGFSSQREHSRSVCKAGDGADDLLCAAAGEVHYSGP